MEIAGVRFIFYPELTLSALGFVLAGIGLGVLSGLTPGLHANNFALLLAATAPSLPGPPTLVGTAMLAAGVVHTFLDVIPALALGVPDAAMAASALPGHRLVLDGRGREALRLSAVGSGAAIVLALPFALPITALMVRAAPLLDNHRTAVLGALTVFLIVTESDKRAQVGGLIAFLASAALGVVALDLAPEAPLDAGGMIAPLFAGLFGAPVLLDATDGGGIPPQADPSVRASRQAVLGTAVAGTVAGAIVGYVPAVSSAIAAVIVLSVFPAASGARGFIVATSGINTANTVFALFALVALGAPRTGVLVALDQAGVPLNIPLLLGAILIAASVSVILVPLIGDRYLKAVRHVNYTRLSIVMLIGLIALSYLFAGTHGVVACGIATLIGLIPPRTGSRRVHLMGVLIGPLMIG